MIKEKYTRSMYKTISWRIIATFTTMILVYLFTEDMILIFKIVFLEVILKMLFYYFHERMWNNITFGKIID